MTDRAWEILRAVRGPIILITFGTLMALSHTGRLEFHRSYPILIILAGVLKLAERMIRKPVPPSPAWPAAGQPYTPHPYPAQQYPAQQYPAQPYGAQQAPPVYPPQTPQGGAQ